jgi:hypothetical protein
LLPPRQIDDRIGLRRQFAPALDDPRDPELTGHPFLEMVRSRVFGIPAGDEDPNREFFERISRHVSSRPAGAHV